MPLFVVVDRFSVDCYFDHSLKAIINNKWSYLMVTAVGMMFYSKLAMSDEAGS